MRFGKRSHGDRVLQFELTPMIDVVFLLIIFFMTTARFAQDTRAELELPIEPGEQREVTEEAGIVVNLDRDGKITINGEEVSLEEFERVVAQAVTRLVGRDPEQLKLTIRADRNADTGHLNEIVTKLRALGVGAAHVATEVPR